ncbi:hypothetical protein CsSME_00049891 [Camellia sinensis var. sinensis]
MCTTSSLKTLKHFLSKRPINLCCCSFHVGCFKLQTKFSKTHYPELSFEDSQLLLCLSNNNFEDARDLLEQIPQRDNSSHVVGWTSLLSKYGRDGFVDEARTLFEIMPERNVVTYNAMISTYLQWGRLNDAYRLFEVMPERSVVSWTSMLCGLMNAGMVDQARELFIVMPERNVVSWNSMVVGLVRNGYLEEARRVFDVMPTKNQVSWNAMISGYVEHCRMEEARALFEKMHGYNVITWTSLIAGYCRVGNVEEGYFLFRRMPERNVVSWTAMIGGFGWNGLYRDALLLFIEMRENYDIKPNGETFISLAYACAGVGHPQLGKQLHAYLIINGWDCAEGDGRLSKSLIHMYSMFGIMDYAHCIFLKNLKSCTVQSCNSMIIGYIQIGQLENAQILFDTVPFRDKISWTSMISGYFSAGKVEEACDFFKRMPDKDDVAWTTMISGYVQNECFAEATCLFAEMRTNGISPPNSTYSVLLGAAGALANLDQGKQFHCLLTKTLPELDLFIENALISMYAKCGEIDDAHGIFSNMISRDLVSWNSMIMGFAHHGLASEALKLFVAMQESVICPNSVTFLGILSACNHAGLVDQGWALFSAMNNEYSNEPGLEHYISMINLLGRAGKLEEAEEFVLSLPFELGHAAWGALLGVCGFGEKNAEMAKRAAQKLLELDPLNVPAFVALRNIYVATGCHIEEQTLRKDMGLKGMKKVPGCSWILQKGRVNVFLSGDRSHPQSDEIFSLLFGIAGESKLQGDEMFSRLSSR